MNFGAFVVGYGPVDVGRIGPEKSIRHSLGSFCVTALGSTERVAGLGPIMASSVDFVTGVVVVINAARDPVAARFERVTGADGTGPFNSTKLIAQVNEGVAIKTPVTAERKVSAT